MSAKDQIKQLVDYFKKENYLKDKTNGMAEGLMLGANLADEANERSKNATETTLAVQEKYKEQILAQDLNPNKDPELVDLRNGNQTAGERVRKFENETTAEFEKVAKSLDYYVPSLTIEAVDGTGSINARTIKTDGMIALYDALVNRFPNYVSRRSMGLDTSGLFTVYAYDFIFNIPGDYIVMDSNIHGDGPGGDPKDNSVALYYFFKDLCENWEKNDKLSTIHNAVNFSVIPVANPWGYDNDSRNNVNGVDLNRNFSWNHTPSSLSGQTPFSEKESQYIRDNLEIIKSRLFNTKQKIIAYIPFHSYGNLTITPRFPYAISTTTPLVVVFRNVAKYLSEKYNYINYDGVSAATASSADNYAERIMGIPAGTPEFPIFRDDGHLRDAFAMSQHVEFYGNLIYQTVNMNILSKTKLSHLDSNAQVEIPKGLTHTLTNLVSRYSENYFPYDTATGEITIPDTMYVSIEAQVSLLSDQSVTADVPLGLYIYKNGGTTYEGVGAFESVIRLGGVTSREKNYTIQLKTPTIHCAKGDKIKVGIYHNQAAGTVKTASNGKVTWISIEEVIRYK